MSPLPPPFDAPARALSAFRRMWREELGEELTVEKARRYGPKLLALVGAVARMKRRGSAR